MLLPAVLALTVQERYDEAVSAAAGFLGAARSLGAVGLLPLPLCLLAHAGWKAGRWEEVRLAAAEASTLSQGTGEAALELYAAAMLALVAGGQGREQSCRDRVERVRQLTESTGIGMFRVTAQAALVHLALGRDRPEDALKPLGEIGALMGNERRVGMLNWHGDHIDALVQLGRLDEARTVLAQLEQDAATSRWEAAVLLRCHGQLEPDDAAAAELMAASAGAFGSWQPYEQARSLLRLAQRTAAAGDSAHEPASAAHVAFQRLRADGWAAQAAALLDGSAAPAVPRRRATDHSAPAHHEPVLPPESPVLAPAPPAGGLEIRLLGGFGVMRDGEPVPVAPGVGCQALKYVALRGGRASADELAEALWPEAEPGRGRTRLRNVLTRLRHDGELLVRDGDEVALPPGTRCDVTLFLDEATAALAASGAEGTHLARRAVERYEGELLPADRYQDWTARARERLRGQHLQLLDRLADGAAAQGEVQEALSWCERAVDADPYDEERYVAMARLLVEVGRGGPANRVVRRALAMLDRLGVSPSAELRSLATQLGA